MKNFKTFGGCSTALLAAFILTPPAFAQTTEDAPTEQPGRIITDPTPTTGTTTGSHIPVTSDGSAPADIITIGGENSGDVDTRATVERYFETTTTPTTIGTANQMYTPTLTGVAEPVHVTYESDGVTIDAVYHPTNTGMLGAPFVLDTTNGYSLTHNPAMSTGGTTTHTAVNPKAIAIGASSVVRGDDSVAIGPGAIVKRVDPPLLGTANQMYTPTLTGVAEPVHVTYESDGVTIDAVYHPSNTGMLGAPFVLDTTNGYTLTHNPGMPGVATPVNVDSATAIGANSEVQGDNGVAIGAGATVTSDGTGTGGIAIGGGTAAVEAVAAVVGVDANGDGDYDDAGDTAPVDAVEAAPATIVTAGANEITIGGDNHTGAINIGDVDVRAEQARITANFDQIAINVEDILTSEGNIKRNRDNIATNKNDIETNTKGIASAIAIAGLATGPGSGLSIGFGSFQSETSIAIGYDNTFGAEQNMTFKAAAASAGSGSTAGSLSMRWAF